MELRDPFFYRLHELAAEHPKIMVVTADMWAMGLDPFKRDFPKRCIDVGIAEQTMVNVAAGLALEGKRPFCVAIASFAVYRCYEQIKLCLSDMRLPITIVGIGPGLSYAWDGPSHHCLHDVDILRILPYMTILDPVNPAEAALAAEAAYQGDAPTYVRLRKGFMPNYGPYHDPNWNWLKRTDGYVAWLKRTEDHVA